MNLKNPGLYDTLKLSILFVLYHHPGITVYQIIQHMQTELSYGSFVGIASLINLLDLFEMQKYVSSKKIDDVQSPQNGRKAFTLTNYGRSSMKKMAQELKAHQAAKQKALHSASLRERIRAQIIEYFAGSTFGYDVAQAVIYIFIAPYAARTFLAMQSGTYKLLSFLMILVFVLLFIRSRIKINHNEKALHHISNAQY